MAAGKTDILLEAGTNELEVIEFGIAGQVYGVNVAKVKKVLHYTPELLTRMAEAPEGVEGIIYFQNKPVTLVNLRSKLKLEGAGVPAGRQLAIITQFNDVVSAYLIDSVNRIHRVSWKALQPFEEVIPGAAACVTGTITLNDRVIMILDLEYLLSDICPEHSIQATTATAAGIARNVRRENLRIVYAEDSGMIRKMTSDQLRNAGFSGLQVFENGQRAHDAIALLAEKAKAEGRPPELAFDLLLTDIEMPQMDGLTLCRHVREKFRMTRLPVVIYSSLINEQMAAKCESVGSSAHISKPRIDQIIGIIDRLCGITAG